MVSKSICIPSSNISIDEMIARFSGRSAHTVRIKNKPTPEGYKILSLCDAGYTFAFFFTSRIHQHEIQKIPNLSKVGNEVYHLVSQLPKNKHLIFTWIIIFLALGFLNIYVKKILELVELFVKKC